MKKILFSLFILLSTSLYATQTFGGYIHYTNLTNNTYEIAVHLFQDLNSPASQREEIEINYGDNSSVDTILKITERRLNNSPFNIVESIYITRHTYNASGIFTITVEEQNRPANIINLPSSLTAPIFLKTSLEVSPNPTFVNNCISINANAIVYSQANKIFKFNLSAFDEDGDFLTYRLVKPRGANGLEISNYNFPMGSSIDLINGEFIWDNTSAELGFHQFSIEITECREDEFVATTTVDFMIYNLASNDTASFINTQNLNRDESGKISYIISPGDSLELQINYQSTDNYSIRLIDGTDRASYDQNGNFKFVSKSEDNRCAPYLFIFEADTRGVVEHETVMIRVIDTNLINCDTLCGFNVLSIENQDKNKAQGLNIYPNPFTNQTTIELPINFRAVDFSLLNNLGQIVQAEISVTDNQIKIYRSSLPEGIYFFRIAGDDKQVYSGKIVAQ